MDCFHLETAAKLIEFIGGLFAHFSKCALKLMNNQTDCDAGDVLDRRSAKCQFFARHNAHSPPLLRCCQYLFDRAARVLARQRGRDHADLDQFARGSHPALPRTG
jgi:hypothetical protein